MEQQKTFRIVQNIRGGKRRKIGVLVASLSPNDKKPQIKWSLCRKADKFSPTEGLAQALNRQEGTMPKTVQKALPKFLDRCKRYFKTEDILVA